MGQMHIVDSGITPITPFLRRWDRSQTLIGTSHFHMDLKPTYFNTNVLGLSSYCFLLMLVKYGREETLTTELNTSHKFEVNFASC